MRRAIAAALIASTMLAGLAHAQPSGGHGGETVDPDSARTMDAPYIAVPVVRNGQLVNYLFVSVRIDIAQGVDLWRTREKAHFVRDAFVRAAHNTPLDDPSDMNQLNEARAVEVFRTAAIQVLGERAVRGVSIISSYSNRASTT